jgi:hypothetical protein
MTGFDDQQESPLFEAKQFDEASVFTPESLLSEARRQKDLPENDVPDVCVLDPDGDIIRHLASTGQGEKDQTWPGYHTDLYRFSLDGQEVGIIGCAVGAPFAVLVAEQLFACECQFLVSVTCVVIRGHDQTHGYGGRAMAVNLDTGATRSVDQGRERTAFEESDCPYVVKKSEGALARTHIQTSCA